MQIKLGKLSPFFAIALGSGVVIAGEADVVKATASCEQRVCSFAVTVKHADTGWKHYANKWDVLTMDGKVIATRILHHPHVNEQPFTRSLQGVKIPEGVNQVKIRAHDSEHTYGGETVVVDIR